MIGPGDYTIQKSIYSMCGKGRWRVLGYISEASLDMVNIDTDERLHFGVGGLINASFKKIDGLVFNFLTGEADHRNEILFRRF